MDTLNTVNLVGELLQYDRLAIASGELWRLVTGHFVHWSAEHAFYSLGTFVGLGALLLRRDPRLLAWTVLLSVVGISGALWFAAPGIQQFRGLSGPGTAAFAALACHLGADLRRRGRRWHLAALGALVLGMVAKLVYEAHTGAFLFADGFAAIPMVHAVGAAAGVAAWGAYSVTLGSATRPRKRIAPVGLSRIKNTKGWSA